MSRNPKPGGETPPDAPKGPVIPPLAPAPQTTEPPPPAAITRPQLSTALALGALVCQEDGQPFPDEATARQFKIFRKLPDNYVPRPHRGGFALIDMSAIEAQERRELTSRPNDPALSHPGARFFWVVFHERRETNEPLQVYLCVDSKPLLFQRGIPVCVPESFLEAARNARNTAWDVRPGQPLKAQGYVQQWPHQVIREATREDYLASIMSGNEQRDRQIGMPVAAA